MDLEIQGNVKITAKQLESGSLIDNKIPNLKHQNTNKSQISIFNVQNIALNCIASFSKSRTVGDNSVLHNDYGYNGLEF